MKKEDFKPKEKKTKKLSIRITKSDFEWMKKNYISPTILFEHSLHKIMKK